MMFGVPNLSGLSRASLRKHFGIIPIFAFVGAGVGLGILAIVHSLKNPEIALKRPKKWEPWNEYEQKQYKLIAVGRDYSNPTPAPKF